eukprot:44506-Lingulodinium_polyedra.AAC.1
MGHEAFEAEFTEELQRLQATSGLDLLCGELGDQGSGSTEAGIKKEQPDESPAKRQRVTEKTV